MKAATILLDEFIQAAQKHPSPFGCNQWLHGIDMNVYVRKSHRYLIGEQRVTTLDITNITVKLEKGEKRFSYFLRKAELLNPWDATYIESVLTERFARFFERKGYTRVPDLFPACFFKMKENNNGST